MRKQAVSSACRVLAILIGAVVLLAAASPSAGGDPTRRVRVKVPDEWVFTQDGDKVRFLSGIVGDRLAAVTFTYTTCTTICPVLDGIFQDLQKKIADELGTETVLVTISIDPVNDIPPRLKAHADRLGAQPGWVFVTGGRRPITRILKGLEVYTPDILNHPPSVFVVDGRRGVWSRLYGFPSSDLVKKIFAEYRAARGGS